MDLWIDWVYVWGALQIQIFTMPLRSTWVNLMAKKSYAYIILELLLVPYRSSCHSPVFTTDGKAYDLAVPFFEEAFVSRNSICIYYPHWLFFSWKSINVQYEPLLLILSACALHLSKLNTNPQTLKWVASLTTDPVLRMNPPRPFNSRPFNQRYLVSSSYIQFLS